MHYYLTLSTKCNLACRYCYGKSCDDFGSDFGDYIIDYDLPSAITYRLDQLYDFLNNDPDASIIFYGGEPLMEAEQLKRVMDLFPGKRFLIQTNGLLLDRLEPKYLNRLETILVSIDGEEGLTDYYRGGGTYRKVVDNLRRIKESGFRGEVIARMTVMKETDINRQVRYLLNNRDFRFNSIHWQLDALFWQSDFNRDQTASWLDSYNRQIESLASFWIDHMRSHNWVLRLYPLIGVMRSLLFNEHTLLRCGAGWAMANIQTDGNISPCPVMAGMRDFYLGNIFDTAPSELRKVYVKEPCTTCSEYWVCGGRCLYANVTKLWGTEGFKIVCGTVKHLVSTLKEYLPAIRDLISHGKIDVKDLDYPLYNSCEIIP